MRHLERLTSVRVVFLNVASESDRDDDCFWKGMPHVVALVSSYLDGAIPSLWTMERAIENGFGLRMIKRLAVHEELAMASGARSSPIDPFYRALLASKALVAAVKKRDDIDAVRWICCEYCPSVVPVKVIGKAASLGRLRVLQWLSTRYPSVPLGRYVMTLADPLSDEYLYRNRQALGNAIAHSTFEVARFLVEHGYELDPMQRRSASQSARSGGLKMLEWLHGFGFAQGTSGWIEVAAASGHLHAVQWLHKNVPDIVCDGHPIDCAAGGGHLRVVQWLHTNRTEGCTAWAMDAAAAKGSLEVVQWLHGHRTEGCTQLAMDGAAASGHLDVVQWLHTNRTEGCTSTAMDRAADGHLAIVRWLHEHRTEGCTTRAMDAAAAGGHLKIVQWLHTHRSEGCTTDAMNGAAKNGHLDVVKWLHEHRSEGCTAAAMNYSDSLDVLEWLRANRSEGCTLFATADAVLVGNFEKLLFLQEHGLGVFSERLAAVALKYCNFEIYQWLRANFPVCVEALKLAKEALSEGTRQTMFLRFESGSDR